MPDEEFKRRIRELKSYGDEDDPDRSVNIIAQPGSHVHVSSDPDMGSEAIVRRSKWPVGRPCIWRRRYDRSRHQGLVGRYSLRTYKARVSLGFIATAGFLLIQGTASAYVETVWPGGLCVQEPGSGGTFAYWSGQAMNSSSTSDLTVMCPLSKTQGQIGNGTYIKVFPRNATISMSCTINEEYISGANTYVTSETQTSGSTYGSNSYTLSFTAMPYGYDLYYAECVVPRIYSGAASTISQIGIIDT